MAGLVGIVDSGADQESIASLLQKMCSSIAHKEWFQTASYASDAVGLGRASLGILSSQPQPLFAKDRSACVVMEGEIYNRRELEQRFAPSDSRGELKTDPALLHYLYETYGQKFAKYINGSFVLALWNNKKRTLTIINDRYGLRPTYYASTPADFGTPARLIFASEVKAILQHPAIKRIIDDEAVADFMAFQIILNNKTFFSQIKVLPPASILTFNSDGHLSLHQYWDFDFAIHYSQTGYADQLAFLVRQAVERQMTSHYGMGAFLSGGLDSRLLVGAIDRKHFPIHTFTQGMPTCNDTTFAARIAARVGSQHHYVEFKPDFLSTFATEGVWLTDGMMSCEHQSILNILPLAKQHCQIVFDGLGGGAILGGSYLKKSYFAPGLDRAQLTQLVYDSFASAFPNRFQPLLFSGSYLSKVRGAPYQSIRQAVEPAPTDHPANVSEYVYLKQRQRHFNFFGPAMTRSQLECRVPFYDNDLVEFAYTIPPELRLNRRIYLKMLCKVFPDITAIGWGYSGIPIKSSTRIRLFVRRSLYRIQNELRAKMSRMTAGRIIPPHDGRAYHDHSLWLRTNLQSWIEDILLSPLAMERGYFNMSYVRQMLDEHMSFKRDHTRRLCTLVTFELWHRQFIDQTTDRS